MRTMGNTTDETTDNGTEAFTGTEQGTGQRVDERAVDAASVGTDDPLVSAAASAAAAPVEMPAPAQEETEKLRAERDALLERMARLQAEFDNARKREARERTDYRAFAISDAVEQFLPVLDNFRLALSSTGTAEQLRTGVELIAKQMEEVLRSLNVTPVETVGVQFDPRVHEALESVERADLPDHQVIDEVRRGYRIKERLLRPALVRIASNPNQTEA
jgi:molecular chaperone GrpE